MAEDGVNSDLSDYGKTTKEYVIEDPRNRSTIAEYEDQELGDDIEIYAPEGDKSGTINGPLLKLLRF